MGKNVKRDVAAILPGGTPSTPNKMKRGKTKKVKSVSDSPQRNVRFDCSSPDKEHVKYVTTPFSSCAKKEEKNAKKKRKEIVKKKKLSFEENDGQLTEKKRAKKRKLTADGSKTQENGGGMSGISDVVVKKQKPSEVPKDFNIIDSSEFQPRVCQKWVDILEDIGEKDSKAKNNSDQKDNTLFVGNLPLTYNHKKVVKLFKKFGEIESARLRCVPVSSVNVSKRVSAITKKFHPNRNSAIAYIVFKSKESVDKAVSKNGMVLDGHHLRIDYASPKKRDLNKSVFVGGLPFDVEDDDLWDAFKNCGDIEDVRIVRDSGTGMGKGFGYVNFKSNASVELALNLDGEEIKNRKINVHRCISQKKRNKKGHKVIGTINISNKQKGKKKKNQNKRNSAKLEKDSSIKDFQGKKAEQKTKKKKNKKTKDESRKKKIKLVLNSAPKKLNKVKKPSSA